MLFFTLKFLSLSNLSKNKQKTIFKINIKAVMPSMSLNSLHMITESNKKTNLQDQDNSEPNLSCWTPVACPAPE